MSFRQRPSLRRRRDTSTVYTARLVRRSGKHRKHKGHLKVQDDVGAQKNQDPQGFATLSDAPASAVPAGVATSLASSTQPTASPVAVDPAVSSLNSGGATAPASTPPPVTGGSPSILVPAVGTSLGILAALGIVVVLLVRRRRRTAKSTAREVSSATEKNNSSSSGFQLLGFGSASSRWNTPIAPASDSVADKPETPSPRETPAIPYPDPLKAKPPLRQQVLRMPPAAAFVREPSTRSMYTISWQGDSENLLPETDFPEFFSPKQPSSLDHT